MRSKARLAKLFLYAFTLLLLGIVFAAYFAPDMMVAITNSVWAMCGW